MVWSLTQSQTSWSVWSSGPQEALLQSGGDGIPGKLFKILKDDAVKELHSVCQQIWKTQQWPQDWKRSVLIPVPKKAMPKNVQTWTLTYGNKAVGKGNLISRLTFGSL